MKTSQTGIDLIKQFEGCKLRAYRDVVGVLTVGYGHTGDDVRLDTVLTYEGAELLLKADLSKFEAAVDAARTVRPNQNQFDAMVCFAYNVGIGGLQKSSVLKAHNRCDFAAAARAFALWNKAGGKVWPGLVRRRAAESALYLTPAETYAGQATPIEHPMPQAVDAEVPMTASPINRASVIAGSTAALASATEVVDAVGKLKAGVVGLENWLLPALLLAVAGLCAYVIYQRYQQRKGGWA